MDSILGECEALGLVVFSNIIYLFIIYSFIINDVILTAFRIIFSTWLYNYLICQKRQGDTKRQSLYKGVSLEDTKLKMEGTNSEKNTATKETVERLFSIAGKVFIPERFCLTHGRFHNFNRCNQNYINAIVNTVSIICTCT